MEQFNTVTSTNLNNISTDVGVVESNSVEVVYTHISALSVQSDARANSSGSALTPQGGTKMRLEEAASRLNQLVDKPLGDVFLTSELRMAGVNKGKIGQLLELALGMPLSNTILDFEDGELKTNKCDREGKPQETIAITQIGGIIDELIGERPFEETHLFQKISNILYVPVCRDGEPEGWRFLPSIHVDLKNPTFAHLKDVWRDDYYSICAEIRTSIEESPNGLIHTSKGVRHIQVRVKDSKNSLGEYHPIYSRIYGRHVSHAKYAFYFKKQFVSDIRNLAGVVAS